MTVNNSKIPAITRELDESDQKIIAAGASRKISTLDFTRDDDAAEFGHLMTDIGVSYGVSIPTTIEEKTFIVGKIKRHFGNLTISDMKLAMEMHSVGQLGDRIPVFGTFNFDWFAQIMTRYRAAKKLAHQNMMRKSPRLPEKMITPEQNLVDLVELWKNGKIPPVFPFSRIFHHLESIGAISITNEEKREIFDAKIGEITERPSGMEFLRKTGNSKDRNRNRAIAEIYEEFVMNHVIFELQP